MGEAVVPEIELLLHDANPDLRIYAVNIIHSMRSPRAPDIALGVIATDPHVNVCAAAVDILAERAHRKGLELIYVEIEWLALTGLYMNPSLSS